MQLSTCTWACCSVPLVACVPVDAGHANRFSPREAHSTTYFSALDSLVVFGGYNLNGVTNELLRFNVSSATWHVLDPGAEGTWVGWHTDVTHSSEEESFTPPPSSSTPGLFGSAGPEARPSARRSHAAFEYDSALFVFGGEGSHGDILNDLWRCDFNGGDVAGMAPLCVRHLW